MIREPNLFPPAGNEALPRNDRAFARKANKTPRDRGVGLLRLRFLPHEFARLKRVWPGPSGVIGGMGLFENKLMDITDRQTLVCELDPVLQDRLERYITKYGPGGPNRRIRAACIPALRRLGIDWLPEWPA